MSSRKVKSARHVTKATKSSAKRGADKGARSMRDELLSVARVEGRCARAVYEEGACHIRAGARARYAHANGRMTSGVRGAAR
eukprot:1395117-Prymnesium_polylepis.1